MAARVKSLRSTFRETRRIASNKWTIENIVFVFRYSEAHRYYGEPTSLGTDYANPRRRNFLTQQIAQVLDFFRCCLPEIETADVAGGWHKINTFSKPVTLIAYVLFVWTSRYV